MFESVNVPLLGVVENMSYLNNPDSEERQYIFGKGGGERTAENLATKFLGGIPLDERIRVGGDNGIPVVIGHPDSQVAGAFREIAAKIAAQLNETS